MPATEMVVSVAMIAGVTLLIIAILRLINAAVLHKTIRKAFETDPDQAKALLDKVSRAPERGGDDRIAIVLLAIGLAMALAPMIAIDDRGLVRAAMGASLFPLLVGGALLIRSWMASQAKRRAGGE